MLLVTMPKVVDDRFIDAPRGKDTLALHLRYQSGTMGGGGGQVDADIPDEAARNVGRLMGDMLEFMKRVKTGALEPPAGPPIIRPARTTPRSARASRPLHRDCDGSSSTGCNPRHNQYLGLQKGDRNPSLPGQGQGDGCARWYEGASASFEEVVGRPMASCLQTVRN